MQDLSQLGLSQDKHRIRERYDSQVYILKRTKEFMHDVGESIHTQGNLSHFEFFLISAIIQYSHPDVQDWEDVKNMTLSLLLTTTVQQRYLLKHCTSTYPYLVAQMWKSIAQ